MRGNEEYELKWKNKLNSLLNNNPDYLKGYSNFIGMNKKISTRYTYVAYVAAFVKSTGKDITKLEADDFAEYITHIYDTKSSSYAITTYSTLKLFAKYLVAKKYVSDNPMEYISRPKPYETQETMEKREQGYLTESEIREINRAIDYGVGSKRARSLQSHTEYRDKLIINLLIQTGLRRSALMRLDRSDLKLELNWFTVTEKGGKVRKYNFSYKMMPLFNRYLREREILIGDKKQDALFVNRFGERMSQEAINRVVKKYGSVIDGKNITAHKLRATYGTQLYEATHDIYFVQQAMGHNSPKTTETYIRGQKDNSQEVSKIMSRFL